MPDIWQQFHHLPRRIRDAVATPSALATLDRLEQQYPNLDTAGLVMRVMVKAVPMERLPDTIATEGQLGAAAAEQVAASLQQGVFGSVGDYLGVRPATPPTPQPTRYVPQARTTSSPLAAPTIPQLPPPPALPTVPQPPPPLRPPAPATVSPPTRSIPQPPPPIPGPALRPAVPTMVMPTMPVGPVAPTQAYSEEDANEIAQQAQRLQHLASPGSALDFDDIARQVLEQHQLAFPEELLTKRAAAILKARLKDIRQSDETVLMLTRDPKLGGLGLDADLAGNLVVSLEARAKELKSRGMVAPRAIPVPPPLPAVPGVMQPRPEPKPPLRTLAAPDNLPVAPPSPPPRSVTEPPRPSRPIKRPPDLPQPPSLDTARDAGRQRPPLPTVGPATFTTRPTLQRNRVLERPKLADITKPSRTFGPAEEMRSLTLAEFRRLGQGAGESTRKLLDKFRHLQQESFQLWADAISGWRQSDIYRLYLEMGRQSLEENIAITEIVQRRARNNQPYLSEHEFTAVADLNRLLQV